MQQTDLKPIYISYFYSVFTCSGSWILEYFFWSILLLRAAILRNAAWWHSPKQWSLGVLFFISLYLYFCARICDLSCKTMLNSLWPHFAADLLIFPDGVIEVEEP